MDSNRRYINMSKLASGRNNKLVPCGSIANAKEIIESVQYQANTILLHFGVNDVEQTQDQRKIAIEFIEVCKMTREKFPDASIIVSELTPRQDDLQNVIKKVNIEINQRIKEVPDCLLINHDNLNSRELFHDKKHLKKVMEYHY